MSEAHVFLYRTLGIVALWFIFLAVKLFLDVRREKLWLRTLEENGKKDELKASEETLVTRILADDTISKLEERNPEKAFEALGYKIVAKPMLREGRIDREKEIVYIAIRVMLSDVRKRFLLAHELIHHFGYGSEAARDPHRFFLPRPPEEQVVDYLAASYLIPKDKFWNEIVSSGYFEKSKEERKAFVFDAADRYGVSTTTIFRRIAELKLLNS